MSAVKSKGSKAERALGQAMWARGIRYRKHVKKVFGTPDFALMGLRVAIFCDGDFWPWARLGEAWVYVVGASVRKTQKPRFMEGKNSCQYGKG